jgi:23S rRNA pseudouridine1911/1915/1917 synthase
MSDTTVTVTGTSPQRLDAFVRSALPALSRRLTRRAIAEGAVRVNGRLAQKGTVVQAGDQVTLPETIRLVAEADLPVAVLYEDTSLIILDKPGGMRGHALDPRERGTVASFLVGRYPETATIGDGLTAGLVHRLDHGTSGLLIAARTPEAFAAMRAAFRRRAVHKEYLAVVTGTPPAVAHVTTALAHDPADRRRMIPTRPGLRSWPAETRFALVAAGGELALIQATMSTGVTHQIRAHLALLGHPVVGDGLYGGLSSPLPEGRHALHAARIAFPHPEGGGRLEITSSLPDDIARLVPGAGDRS